MINVGILGGETIEAGELLRLLINHPDSCIKWVASDTMTGPVANFHKGLTGECDFVFASPSQDDLDLVFCCNKSWADWCLDARAKNHELRVIDLTRSIKTDEGEMYGLCEINRKFMVHDCYDIVTLPTPEAMVSLLAIIPMAKNQMLNGDIEIKLEAGNLCGPVDSATLCREISTVIKALQPNFNSNIKIMTSTSGPLPRGITSTVTMPCSLDSSTIKQLFIEYYDDHNFTFVSDIDIDTSHVVNTNKCLINISTNNNELHVTSAADILLKGEAGNAVHAMNLLFGLHERTGLALKAQVY